MALALQFPNLADCLGGAQGGANSKGRGAFLGFNFLNAACWLQRLAESEKDLDIRSRLKCGDDHYRDAITFDMRGSRLEKTQACIAYVKPRWQAILEHEREAAEVTCALVGGKLSLSGSCIE
jgi:hypothetical protein